MIICDEVKIQLTSFQDNELGEEHRRKLIAHLNACPTCLQEFREIEAVWAMLEQYPGVEPSPYFKSNFWQRVELLEHQTVPTLEKIKGFIHIRNWRFAAMNAALVVLLLVAYTFYVPRTPITEITELDKFDNQLLQEVNRLMDNETDEYLSPFDEWPSIKSERHETALSKKKS